MPFAYSHGLKIIIHRVTHQIGGSCLEVAAASIRLILDVGPPLDDLAAPATIPPAERSDEMVSEVFARSPEVAAVLISHAHADHTGLLHLMRANDGIRTHDLLITNLRRRKGDIVGETW